MVLSTSSLACLYCCLSTDCGELPQMIMSGIFFSYDIWHIDLSILELLPTPRYGRFFCWYADHRGPQHTLSVSCQDTQIGE